MITRHHSKCANAENKPHLWSEATLGATADLHNSGGGCDRFAWHVAEHKENASVEISIHDVEKDDESGRPCRINLALHNLEGEIRYGGNVKTYRDNPHGGCA